MAVQEGRERQAWGYRSAGTRELTAEERGILKRQVRKWKFLRLVWGLATVVFALVLIVSFMAFYGEAVKGIWMQAVAAIALILCILAPLQGKDAKKRVETLRNELEDGTVERFERDNEERITDDESPRSFEIYCGSGRVLEHGDLNPEGIGYANPRDVAATPPRLHNRAMPSKVDYFRGEIVLAAPVRRLSSPEMDELSEIAQSTDFSPLAPIAATLLIAGGLAGGLPKMGQIPETGQVVRLLFFGALTIWILRALVLRSNLRMALHQDLQQGEVVIVPEESPEYQRSMARGRIEVLPTSKIVWSVDDKAATWRSS